ncbi:hypothetical protein a10_09477 [Streptomyces acidiscabies]|nr:hypothetical protein a10_09477 [Streptomyces acidiscabies]
MKGPSTLLGYSMKSASWSSPAGLLPFSEAASLRAASREAALGALRPSWPNVSYSASWVSSVKARMPASNSGACSDIPVEPVALIAYGRFRASQPFLRVSAPWT